MLCRLKILIDVSKDHNGFDTVRTAYQSTLCNILEDLNLREIDTINNVIMTSRELTYLSIEKKFKLGVRLYSSGQ